MIIRKMLGPFHRQDIPEFNQMAADIQYYIKSLEQDAKYIADLSQQEPTLNTLIKLEASMAAFYVKYNVGASIKKKSLGNNNNREVH